MRVKAGERPEAELFRRVKAGERPDDPEDCPEVVLSIMYRCWDGNPAQRMKAREALALLQELEDMLSRKSADRRI